MTFIEINMNLTGTFEPFSEVDAFLEKELAIIEKIAALNAQKKQIEKEIKELIQQSEFL
jgi:cell division septum initiation protein DivIVA